MIIGDRLREMREEKKLSQGDIEKRATAEASSKTAIPLSR